MFFDTLLYRFGAGDGESDGVGVGESNNAVSREDDGARTWEGKIESEGTDCDSGVKKHNKTIKKQCDIDVDFFVLQLTIKLSLSSF